MITRITELPANTLGFRASGVVTAEDYRTQIEPALADALAHEATVNMVYIIGDDVERFSLGAMVQDAKVGRTPEKVWGRIAVVTDVHWIAGAVHLSQHLYRCEVRVFGVSEEAEAITWATATDTAATG